ncbi:hypothetical protein C0991_003529, partial [Blastosporella zonata]
MANLIEGTYATSGGVFQPGRDFTPKTDGSVSNSKDNIDPILRTSSTHSVGSTSQISNIITPANTTPPTPSAPALTSTAATSSLCKCNAEDDEPTSNKCTRSHCKQSSGQALSGMASSIAQLANAIANDSAIPFPQYEQIKVFKIIRRDTTFADTLLAIKKKSTQMCFIQ